MSAQPHILEKARVDARLNLVEAGPEGGKTDIIIQRRA